MLAQYHRKKKLVAKFDRVYYFIHIKKALFLTFYNLTIVFSIRSMGSPGMAAIFGLTGMPAIWHAGFKDI
jgi:hypothetical protein